MIRFCLAFLPLLVVLPAALWAQTPSERVRALGHEAAGYSLVGQIRVGALPKGGEGVFPVELAAGSDYVVVGFCDEQCDDLDLLLLDPAGATVTSDVLPDAEPTLRFTAEESGLHEVWVVVVGCSAESCSFGAGVYAAERREQSGVGGGMVDRLAAFRIEFQRQGFTELSATETGALGADQEIRLPLTLQEGMEYRIVGACDNHCEKLDLVLYDPSGNETESDRMDDAIPILEVTGPSGGVYQLAVHMVACAVQSCGFEVVSFVRGEDLDRGEGVIASAVVSEVTHRGTLEAGDPRLRDGEFYDTYTLDARVGQTIIVDLRSDDFDTFLILKAPGGSVEQNDDHEGNPHHSRIEVVALESGAYTLVVTSFSPGETGQYALKAMVIEDS